MLGRVIVFLMILVFIIAFTAMDISNLRDGIGGYIQHPSGMLFTTLCLMVIPTVLDLKPSVGLWVIIILEVVYITFYTWIYFKIKEERGGKMSDKSNNNNVEDIIIWLIVGVTGIIAFIIGRSIGVRSRSILYMLAALELAIYTGIKWIFNNL